MSSVQLESSNPGGLVDKVPGNCSRGHTHQPWPQGGDVVIEKRDQTCQYCPVKAKTAGTLRKTSTFLV
ncbi:hypothetical protein K469DRAFT_703343 [Zopfia rhizophila CBS 207.26]|uniref:Uncharacterized protein n=1 Tax=Zopfia rhizophila CBS 207.26 TaxID=1314779 RepID=A0A6A6EC31_9PEZI|nr:hypothetical protein K469DRAFT_703343 [Zopfia rhizophila CBS 207.26]